jgi:uncharacterized protein
MAKMKLSRFKQWLAPLMLLMLWPLAMHFTPVVQQAHYTNRLSKEKSPYLQLHAQNPVDWYAWGEEAFEKARREDKVIFLSVGYATCHWCHVMERESFSDPAIAAVMNKYFVSIKVDREERPDIDRLYLTFMQLTTGGSGYPMSLFLTPDRRPIYGGTYFPKEERFGLPSFRAVLDRLAEAWEKDRGNVLQSTSGLTEALSNFAAAQASGIAELDQTSIDRTYERFAAQYDKVNGGFENKPKFPQPAILIFLLRYYARTGLRNALDITLHSLRAIADGGIHDHLGGGFFRYSTDAQWKVPHFEKMLYDQAQMAVAYIDAYQASGDSGYGLTARDVLEYVLREMRSPQGAFYSAEDADAVYEFGERVKREGAFYVWRAHEIKDTVGNPAADIFIYHYGIQQSGNIPAEQDPQGDLKTHNVLFTNHSVAVTALHFRKSESEVRSLLAAARQKLFERRQQRPRPSKDDKVLTAWNGLMISALSRGAQVFDDGAYEQAASGAAAFIKSKLYDSAQQTLSRRYREEDVAIDGFLEDYAFLIQGLLDLYETTFDLQWLTWAAELQAKQDELFWDSERGAYFASSGEDPSVLFRMRDEYDGAEPSGNSIAAMNLLRLSQMTGREEWAQKADRTFIAFSNRIEESPDVLPQMMAALDFSLSKPKQIIIAGAPAASDTRRLLRLIHQRYLPRKFLMVVDGGPGQQNISKWLPFVGSMQRKDGKATAYICQDYVCKLPTADPEVAARLLSE